MYKIHDNTFTTFEEVIQWAWNTHKLDFHDVGDDFTEVMKHEACRELENLIDTF